jgi:hypothetical protein
VVNWTSDRRRRSTWPWASITERRQGGGGAGVGGAQSSSILGSGAPGGVHQFDDSSIDFELRAWTNQFERWPKIKTELAAGGYAALHAAGMSPPFPQREVRVLHDGPYPAPTIAGRAGTTPAKTGPS